MRKSRSESAAGRNVDPKVADRPSDDELFERLLQREWRDDVLDGLGDKDEVMRRLFDIALSSLKRSNAIADKMLRDSARHRDEFNDWLASHKASQAVTQSMIEDLVNG